MENKVDILGQIANCKGDTERVTEIIKHSCFWDGNNVVYPTRHVKEMWKMIRDNIAMSEDQMRRLQTCYEIAIRTNEKYKEVINNVLEICNNDKEIATFLKETLKEHLTLEIWQGRLSVGHWYNPNCFFRHE